MNATLDWGNTRVKIGLFEGQRLRRVDYIENNRPDVVKILSDYLQNVSPGSILWMASGEVSEAGRLLFEDLKATPFTHQTTLAHSSVYATPHTLGLDRILNMEAAYFEFPQKNVLVIDMGTCITYDILNSEGVHEGGSIAPGWKMRLSAMHEFTASLPHAEALPTDLIGVDTLTSLQSGAYNGMKNELTETIRQYEARYSNLHVILTGGDAEAFDLQAKKATFARQNYTLHGLNAILLQHAQ